MTTDTEEPTNDKGELGTDNFDRPAGSDKLTLTQTIMAILMLALAAYVIASIANDDPITGFMLADFPIYFVLHLGFIVFAALFLYVVFGENLKHVSVSRWSPMTFIFILYLFAAVRLGSFSVDLAADALRGLVAS